MPGSPSLDRCLRNGYCIAQRDSIPASLHAPLDRETLDHPCLHVIGDVVKALRMIEA
ncbi:MAG: hypothetical protein ACI8T1_003220, partial [Verrucomicrobiales bacterium]